jgi:hypothetical protein
VGADPGHLLLIFQQAGHPVFILYGRSSWNVSWIEPNAADLGHNPLDLDLGRRRVQCLPMVDAFDEFVADLGSFDYSGVAA